MWILILTDGVEDVDDVLAGLLIGERIMESLVGCSQPVVVVMVVKIEKESSLVQEAKRRT